MDCPECKKKNMKAFYRRGTLQFYECTDVKCRNRVDAEPVKQVESDTYEAPS